MSKEIWEKEHQPFELKWHQGNNYRWNNSFVVEWEQKFNEFMELSKDEFTDNDILLDIGCGSRPCLDYFNSGKKYHLDPLLKDYLKIEQVQKYWTDKTEDELLMQPAEELVKHLVGKCDFIVCCNVLDHTYDWESIINNIIKYSKKGTKVFFFTDLDGHGPGHPGIDDVDKLKKIIDDNFIKVKDIDYKGSCYKHVFYSLKYKGK
jgi:hypothetical protein